MRFVCFLLVSCALSAQAASARSVNECAQALNSEVYTGSGILPSTAIYGSKASSKMTQLRKKGAKEEFTIDAIGYTRARTVTLKTTLATKGTNPNSCEGVYTASKVEICTSDVEQQNAACAVKCEISWQGEDCR